MATLDERYEAYKTDGFTIFEKVFDEPQMQSWREKHKELSAANDGQTWFGNTLELVPELMWPTVSHPIILEFIEKVMGPFVQLDNLTLAAFPPMEKEKAEGRVSGWAPRPVGTRPLYGCISPSERHQRYLLSARLDG